MRKIRIGQIGIGHNHGEAKMRSVRKFGNLFEVTGYAEEDETWVASRGNNAGYRGLPRLSVRELLEKSDAVLVETDVPGLTEYAKKCVAAGKHVHMDKPASGTLADFKEVLDTAREKNLVVQLGYMYRYNPAVQKAMQLAKSGESRPYTVRRRTDEHVSSEMVQSVAVSICGRQYVHFRQPSGRSYGIVIGRAGYGRFVPASYEYGWR